MSTGFDAPESRAECRVAEGAVLGAPERMRGKNGRVVAVVVLPIFGPSPGGDKGCERVVSANEVKICEAGLSGSVTAAWEARPHVVEMGNGQNG
ncbi:uncharacterized protein A4U43_C10F16540 [Asparagus officinalis]|uniref:Uncharacterized protein n=1 Tax=Asparagus officinalis TaxID=4686 RepID=A0A5P1E543_ASPOF|nr:uncharacterized protein A4U43_C10F16540 [Asparagus officinalis]